MARVYIEFDPTNLNEVAAVVDLLAPKHSNDAKIFEMVQQILVSQNAIQVSLTKEEGQLTVITDQITALDTMETQEHQAILDAAQRVDDKLNALVADNPTLASDITGIQTDIANLANIAAASGTTSPVPVLPDTPGTPAVPLSA